MSTSSSSRPTPVRRPERSLSRGLGLRRHRITSSQAPTTTALVLHTSGTTARPKIVPLTHRNLLASARNVARVARLQADDRCLNVMPFFHIHGLVAALLASLNAGGSSRLYPGFPPAAVLRLAPVPRADVDHGGADDASGRARALRRDPARDRAMDFGSCARRRRRYRSRFSTASKAPLGIPVVEAYGMTEAAHQMASNPLPPGSRKPGSVGPAAGPEVAYPRPTERMPTGRCRRGRDPRRDRSSRATRRIRRERVVLHATVGSARGTKVDSTRDGYLSLTAG